ncbi:hypothetical protein OAY83_00110 [Candidatus Marinimicrobia bacterium]|nr:hypothetical protein [Candidatus Neomarinimicrobiota bacterium]
MKRFKYILTVFLCLIIPNENQNCKVLTLNHIKSDNAIALLKSLGYFIVDFTINDQGQYLPKSDTIEGLIVNQDGLKIIPFPYSQTEYLDTGIIGDESEYGLEGMSSYLGGSSMPDIISGDPPERLMVCFDEGREEKFVNLLDFLKNKVDVPALQVMIEALVIEINSDELNELGIDLYGQGENFTVTTPTQSTTSGTDSMTGLLIEYSDAGLVYSDGTVLESMFSANLEAIMSSTSGEILSKPSVMVMDGRQARIQIGQNIPISRTTSSTTFTSEDIEYVPTGIILNIRPRINDNNNEILMQVETIITDPESLSYNEDGILITPIINNRKVETFVRVENNNPFIIGGLISDKKYDNKGGIPGLSKIPLLGKFFSREGKNNVKKEVIIVLTPHIISSENKSFSRVIPQNSYLFDSFGNELFPNSYRLKDDDIFDLSFIKESKKIQKLVSDYNSDEVDSIAILDKETKNLLKEGILPGEDILVRRMIYEIIERENYFKYINPEKIIFPSQNNGIQSLSQTSTNFGIFDIDHPKALILKFIDNKDSDKPFVRPAFSVESVDLETIYGTESKKILYDKNQVGGNAILISNDDHLKRLYEIIILKKILKLNPDLKLNINSFKTGLEIIFPSTESLINNELFIDREIAQYYYEVNWYYEAFENKFNKKMSFILGDTLNE